MNTQIFFFFYDMAHRSQALDQAIIFFGVYLPCLVAGLAAIYLIFFRKSVREIVVVFFSVFFSCAAAEILKFLIHIPRPFVVLQGVHNLFAETGYAFPSIHATLFSALAFSVFFINKKIGYVFIFFALLISVARVMGGVHFPIDILGGFALGGLVSYFVAFFVKSV